jgi:hypothetical protein
MRSRRYLPRYTSIINNLEYVKLINILGGKAVDTLRLWAQDAARPGCASRREVVRYLHDWHDSEGSIAGPWIAGAIKRAPCNRLLLRGGGYAASEYRDDLMDERKRIMLCSILIG